ncbi:hypothetical protein [Couchioplanes caeruleus]|uniref:hypothetical protein n=1 Tax=Couchioplanes caeruleus TaxID=56438 RepID=UPI0011CE4399|nr:hypothetical protein [Couchioplanes caeruleus]
MYGTGFRGWIVVAVRAPELLRESLRTADVTGVTAVVTGTATDGRSHEIARWTGDGGPVGSLRDTVDVEVAGTVWHVLVRPTAALAGTGRTVAAPLTMLGAVVVSLLAAAGLLAAEAGRNRAAARARREAADARTAEGRERAANDRARAANDEARAARDQLLAAEDAVREREAELSGFATAAGERLHAPLHTIASVTEMLVEDAAAQLDQASREPNPGGGSIFWFTVAAATTAPAPETELFAADLA